MARKTETQKYVEAYCLQDCRMPEDLDTLVRRYMNAYTAVLQCIPGCETKKAKLSKTFNIWNWRRVVIDRPDLAKFRIFLVFLLYRYGVDFSPGKTMIHEIWNDLDARLLAAGDAIWHDLKTHTRLLASDYQSTQFNPLGYDNTDVFTHYMGLHVLNAAVGGLENEIEMMYGALVPLVPLFFPKIELLRTYMEYVIEKETNVDEQQIALGALSTVLSDPKRPGPPCCNYTIT